LRTVAQVPDYTSHVIRRRNLDMAVAGEFEGDGQVDTTLPRSLSQPRDDLVDSIDSKVPIFKG